MKNLLVLFFTLTYFCCTAQENHLLRLEKNHGASPVALTVKPDKKLIVKTSDGQKFTLLDYTLFGDTAIASATDTVSVNDIVFIKGNVYGNTLRKVGGGLLTGSGMFYAAGATAVGLASMMSVGSLPFFLLALPSLGVTYVGSTLVGARRFDTSEKWTLNIVPKAE